MVLTEQISFDLKIVSLTDHLTSKKLVQQLSVSLETLHGRR